MRKAKIFQRFKLSLSDNYCTSLTIDSLGHNFGIFHNFLVAANWVGNSHFWNFPVASTADWLGNQCALLWSVMESLHVADRLLAVSFLHWSYEQIVTIPVLSEIVSTLNYGPHKRLLLALLEDSWIFGRAVEMVYHNVGLLSPFASLMTGSC